MTLLQLTTSCDRLDLADELAAHIIDMGLAACVQITPITSHYIWEGQRQIAQEFKLDFKTHPALRVQIEKAVLAAHSYELPEIIFTPITASADYANWVKDAVKAKL